MLRYLAQSIDIVPAHLRRGAVRRGAAARSRPGIRFVDLGDCMVRLRDAGGDGPSLLLAADPPVPVERYDALLAELAGRWRAAVFEVPGFGASLPRIGFRYSLPRAVARVERLLEAVPGAPHVLVMPCVTGYVALALAARRPELVRALVLPQMPTWDDGQRWLAGRDPRHLLRRPLVGQALLHRVRRRRIADWYAAALGPQGERAAFIDDTLRHFDDGGAFPLASAFQDYLTDPAPLPSTLVAPLLLPWGDADPSHRGTDFTRIKGVARDARVMRFAGCGHFPELEDPARSRAALDEFHPEARA